MENEKTLAILATVYDFYNREASDAVMAMWLQLLAGYDYRAIGDAFVRHMRNPDSGQYLPKPADIVKLIDGGTQDSALVAWAQVDKAVRRVGSYSTVVFDDAITHAVISDMGGWPHLCSREDKEWPFVRNEFVTRHRAIKLRGLEGYPRKLTGIIDRNNAAKGLPMEEFPVAIGDPGKCRLVYEGGLASMPLRVTNMFIPLLEEMKRADQTTQ